MRGLVVLLVGEGCTRLASFLAITQLTRRLGDRGFAPVAVALAALSFAALAVEMGFPLFGAREVARDRGAVARLLPRILPTQLLIGGALWLLAWIAARAGLVAPELGELLPGYAATLLLLPFALSWVFQGRGEMLWVTLPQLVRQLVFLAAVFLLVHAPSDRTKLPWAELLAVASAAAIALLAFRPRGRLALAPRGAFAAEIVREALPIGGSQLLWALRMYLPTLLLWRFVARESVARYDAAHRVMMVMQALLTMYFTNLYPELARAAHAPRERLRSLLGRSLLLAFGATLAVAAAVALAAPRITGLLFGADFAHPETGTLLALLVFLIPLLALRGHARMTLLALGRARTELACSVAGTALLAASLPFLAGDASAALVPAPSLARGAAGAALAMLGSEAVATLLTFLALRCAWRQPERPAPLAPIGSVP